MLRHFAGIPLLLGLFISWAASASPSNSTKVSKPAVVPKAANNKLDTAHIHRTYIDGDFDLAIELIEDAMKYGGPFSHEDSIFMFKHLGVMHTAKYETREKGKHYLVQLLHVEPTAKLMDMYASDMIYMIFKNLRDEFESSRPDLFPIEPRQPKQPLSDQSKPKRAKSYAWLGWTGGAVAAMGGVALTLHLLEEQAPKKRSLSSEE